MKKFTSVNDIDDLPSLLAEALRIKKQPHADKEKGKDKTLGLIFLNPSLRTRLSTQKAGLNLGMNVMVMNIDKEGWGLEFQDGAVMNGSTVEHVREAAAVLGQYCDILGIRCFPGLVDREEDYGEDILNKFIKYSGVPVVSLESATLHPLQSFADLITIEENKTKKHPKVVLAWAPHVRSLPQAVPNSFSEWMCRAQKEIGLDFVIAQPEGLELNPEFTRGAGITSNLEEALTGADFVYVKNWSSYKNYGQPHAEGQDWMIDNSKLKMTNNARVMHCLPVRREVELAGEVLDSPSSLVIQQAANRLVSAQTVLKRLLEAIPG